MVLVLSKKLACTFIFKIYNCDYLSLLHFTIQKCKKIYFLLPVSHARISESLN